MNIENFYNLLFNLYGRQEKMKIKYELENKNFSTDSFNKKDNTY